MAPSDGCAVRLIAAATHGCGEGALVGAGATVVGAAAVVVGAATVVVATVVDWMTSVVGTRELGKTVMVGGAAEVADVELLSPQEVAAASAITATGTNREPNMPLFYRDSPIGTRHIAGQE